MSEKVLCTSSVLEWKWEIRVKECAQRGLVCTICIWNVNQDLDYYFKIRVKECAQRGLSILFALAFVFVCTIWTCISNVNQDLDYYFFQVPMDKSEEMVKNQKSSLAKSKFILCKDHQGLLKSFPKSLSLFETEERLVGTEPWPSMFRLAMHHDFDSAYISADNIAFPPKNNHFRLLLLSYHRHNPAIFAPSAVYIWFGQRSICNQIGTLRLWLFTLLRTTLGTLQGWVRTSPTVVIQPDCGPAPSQLFKCLQTLHKRKQRQRTRRH